MSAADIAIAIVAGAAAGGLRRAIIDLIIVPTVRITDGTAIEDRRTVTADLQRCCR